MTAANPPEVDLTLSTHGGTSPSMKSSFEKETECQLQGPLKLSCHFQDRGTSPRMNSPFEKET